MKPTSVVAVTPQQQYPCWAGNEGAAPGLSLLKPRWLPGRPCSQRESVCSLPATNQPAPEILPWRRCLSEWCDDARRMDKDRLCLMVAFHRNCVVFARVDPLPHFWLMEIPSPRWLLNLEPCYSVWYSKTARAELT